VTSATSLPASAASPTVLVHPRSVQCRAAPKSNFLSIQLQPGQQNYTFPHGSLLNPLDWSSFGDFVVHGTVNLTPSQDGSTLKVNDTFDFDVGGANHPWFGPNGQFGRNIETLALHFTTDPLDAITDPNGNGTGSANASGNGGFPFNFTSPIPAPQQQQSVDWLGNSISSSSTGKPH
jgi:hypothetical protein